MNEEETGLETLEPEEQAPEQEQQSPLPEYVTKDDFRAFADQIAASLRQPQQAYQPEAADEEDPDWFTDPAAAKRRLKEETKREIMDFYSPILERMAVPMEVDRMAAQFGNGDVSHTARLKAELAALSAKELIAIQENPGLARLVTAKSTPVPRSEGRGVGEGTPEDQHMINMFNATGGKIGGKKMSKAEFAKAWKEIS